MNNGKVTYQYTVPDGWISSRDAAAMLGIAPQRLSAFDLPRIKIGRSVYYNPETLTLPQKERNGGAPKITVATRVTRPQYDNIQRMACMANCSVASLLNQWITEKLEGK